MLPLFWLWTKHAFAVKVTTVLLIWKIHPLKDISLSLVKNWTSNHMQCFLPSGTLGFVCCTLRLTVNSLTYRYINIINHEFQVFHSGVAEDMIMHQQVIGSWYSKAMQWPNLERSRCPRRDLVTDGCSIISQKDGILIIHHHFNISHPFNSQVSLSAKNYIHIPSTLWVSHLSSSLSKSLAFHFYTSCVSTSRDICFLTASYLIIQSAIWPVCIHWDFKTGAELSA